MGRQQGSQIIHSGQDLASWLGGHIPPFLELPYTYERIIRAQFYGHGAMCWVFLFYKTTLMKRRKENMCSEFSKYRLELTSDI